MKKPVQYVYGISKQREEILAKSRLYEKKAVERGAALGIAPAAVAAFTIARDNAEASHLLVMDPVAARPLDYRHNDECFETLVFQMVDMAGRFFRIPPCTQEDLDDVEAVVKVNRNIAFGRPQGGCILIGIHTGTCEMRFRSYLSKESIPDAPGGVVGRMWKFDIRDLSDAQLTVGQMTNGIGTNGKSIVVIRPLSDLGKVLDISVALKNGSGETGPWCPVQSFVLS